ncbi:MAG TPA: MotA/TolQ/ExbB proton channel family protein [Polyangiaceae bacterium]|jgi:biopolymer transport protein ExbB/TolQ|nr:MotA/TolQ/ExbB proton channel family protein [Polyangiaceae bacterium]
MNLFDRLSRLSEFGSVWILWLLVCLSIFASTVAIERAILFYSSRDDVLSLRRELRQMLSLGKVALARRRLEHSPSFEARVAVAGLDSENAACAEERMRGENRVARLTMERHLGVLGALGKHAPVLGLLGTVLGIVRALREPAQSNGQVSLALIPKIGEALVTTALGLLVALPAIVAFNLFRRTIRARLGRADALSGEVLAHLKSGAPSSTTESSG